MRRRTGCLLAASVPAFGLFLFIASFGLVRTSTMESPAASTDAFTLEIASAADPTSSQGDWPVTYSDVYPDSGEIRGTLNPGSRTAKVQNLQLIISSPSGPSRIARCLSGYRDICYFDADLRPAKLEQGVVVLVLDANTGKPVSPPISFSFTRRVAYSSAWWAGLMSV
jgi:hypothetical protein